jgi:hypothetical protein
MRFVHTKQVREQQTNPRRRSTLIERFREELQKQKQRRIVER